MNERPGPPPLSQKSHTEPPLVRAAVDPLSERTTRPWTPLSALSRDFHIIAAWVLLLLYASPLIFFQIPGNHDALTESAEPIKTLKFVHSKGRAFHKWGPMPSFVYAPVYAPFLAYWHFHGDLGKISTDYPYGFQNPNVQQGALIVAARITGLLVASVCILLYGRALTRFTNSRLAVFLALTLCITTSPELIVAFVSTKPDGMMLAFLAGSLASYIGIISEGLTKRRGFFLSLLAVCSISCKELTAPLFVSAYCALAIRELMNTRGQPELRRCFLWNFAFTIAVGVFAYLLINVAYAPATWRLRIGEWISGPLKDPNIWSPPGYTLQAYLVDAIRGATYNLGPGGTAIVLIAMLISFIVPGKNRILVWSPFVGYGALLLLLAGYMPNYFLSPLNVAATLPVADALARAGTLLSVKSSRALRAIVATLVMAFCLINMAWANLGWITPYISKSGLLESYCVRKIDRQELIHTGNTWVRQPGSSRLSYLGFNLDDRALGELMAGAERMPDVFLIGQGQLEWLDHFKQLPARNELEARSGFNYRDFPGFETLGYRMVEVYSPRPPRWLDFPVIRAVWISSGGPLLVYRRVAP